ncbi:hypothetical protein [Streptomyces tirandamycinicus]|uniref:Lipoprotein n=1 Tax=Streptomyces tirandamycinicus TaxID=2174846 RepID=A0A2S1T0U0_9ACTN|nr:hypothetical protein [Streptomyces tirandamycinicus]AWI32272.1 hypothetical protein DDW44_28380 [Streptomyces tirandamycinicus]
MRAIPVASAALMGAAALALTLPTAAADTADGAGGSVRKQPFSFAVTPSTVAPGGTVTLGVSGCGTTATASSGVFDTVTIPPRQTATARVDLDARRGAVYSVQFTCNNQTGTTDLTISGGGAATPTTRSTSTAAPRPQPQGVKGGLGGSIGGMNAVEITAGVGLVLAASGGVVYVVRRRSGSRLH